jgi:hypothetical protein
MGGIRPIRPTSLVKRMSPHGASPCGGTVNAARTLFAGPPFAMIHGCWFICGTKSFAGGVCLRTLALGFCLLNNLPTQPLSQGYLNSK